MRRELPPGGPVPDPEREVREEIEHYLEERARELEADGMDPEAARAEAGRAFGDVTRIEAEVEKIRRGRKRDEGRTRVMESIRQDLKLALRSVVRRPGFAAVVIATLALGIGAVTAIFSVVNAALLEALPFDGAEDLVFVQGAYQAPEGPQVRGASYPEFEDWQQGARSFTRMTPVSNESVNLSGAEGPALRLQAEQVGEGYFELLSVTPTLGRVFTDDEMVVPGGAAVTLLSESLWTDRFGRDPQVVGQTLSLNGNPFTVVGILPDAFRGTNLNADLWLPIGTPPFGIDADLATSRGNRWMAVLARLGPGVALESAQQDMDAVATRLEQSYPDAHEDRVALVTPMREAYMGNTSVLVLLVLSASGLLLLIAAANVANLLLVRTTGRGGEVLMRKALGAGRGRLVSQFLTESMVLAVLGSLAGLALGAWGAHALVALMPDALLPSYVEVGLDARVFGMTVLLMSAVGLLAGLAPALLTSGTDLAGGLREGGRGSLSRSRARIQRFFVAGQIALALILMVGAALMTRSFQEQLEINTGFDQDQLYAFRVTLPAEPYPGDALRAAVQELEQRLESTAGVSGVTFGGGAPLRGGYTAAYLYVEGQEDRIRFYLQRVASDWFETMGTEVRQGRPLDRSDLDNPEVTVISQALASRFFPGRDPVGQTIRIGSDLELRIVGVAEDVRFRDLTTDLVAGADDPDIYMPWDRFATRTLDFVLRTNAEPAALERAVREVVAGFDPQLPVFLAQPLNASLEAQTSQARFGSTLLTSFGLVALVLALVGLYGVLSFTVDQRQREIALRMAVGAEAGNVRRMVVSQGMRLAVWGLGFGLVAAGLASRALEAFLYEVEALDLVTYVAAALGMAAVAAIAAWIPAIRATRVNPQGALKAE